MNRNGKENNFAPGIEQVLSVLQGYKKVHPYAQIDARRRSHVSLRIRIIDPDFRGVNRVDREKELWPLLDELPDDPFQDITI